MDFNSVCFVRSVVSKMRTTENTILCTWVLRFPTSVYSSVVLTSAADSPPRRNGWFGMSITAALRVWHYCRSFVWLYYVIYVITRIVYRWTLRRCVSASVGYSFLNFIFFRRFCCFSVMKTFKTSIISKLTLGTYYALQCILVFTTSTNADVDFEFCKNTCLACVFVNFICRCICLGVGPILCSYRFSFRRWEFVVSVCDCCKVLTWKPLQWTLTTSKAKMIVVCHAEYPDLLLSC